MFSVLIDSEATKLASVAKGWIRTTREHEHREATYSSHHRSVTITTVWLSAHNVLERLQEASQEVVHSLGGVPSGLEREPLLP
jgi:hypothetical protein